MGVGTYLLGREGGVGRGRAGGRPVVQAVVAVGVAHAFLRDLDEDIGGGTLREEEAGVRKGRGGWSWKFE